MALTYLGISSSIVTANSYSFPDMPLGAEASDRYIIASVVARKAGVGLSITGVTIAGVPATLLRGVTYEADSNSQPTAIFMAAIPTGTSATVVVTFNENSFRTSVALHSLTGMDTPNVYDFEVIGRSGSQADTFVDAPANSYVLSNAMQGTSTTNPRWNVGSTVQDYGSQFNTNGYHTGSSLEVNTTTAAIRSTFNTDNVAVKTVVTIVLRSQGAVAEPITRRFIPTPSAWYKADSITGLSDGDRVTAVVDSSGSGHSLAPVSDAIGPIYRPAGINGIPTLEFTGSATETMSSSLSMSQNNITMIAVIKSDLISGNHNILDSSMVGGVGFRQTTTSISVVVRGILASTVLTTGAVTAGESLIVSTAWDTARSVGYKNGTVGTSNAYTPAMTAGTTLLIGGGSSTWDGFISEVIIYHRQVTTEERATIHSYLQDKYSIIVSDYIAPPATSGGVRVWDGTAFVMRPVQVWDGTSWALKPASTWKGTSWEHSS